MTNDDQNKNALNPASISAYVLQLDTRDEQWKKDARMAVKYRVKFIIVRFSLQDVSELDDLFKQFGYFYHLDEATNAMYCDPGKPPILPVRKSEQLFPQNSKRGLKHPLPSRA